MRLQIAGSIVQIGLRAIFFFIYIPPPSALSMVVPAFYIYYVVWKEMAYRNTECRKGVGRGGGGSRKISVLRNLLRPGSNSVRF